MISNLRSKQDPCSLSCYVHVTMHKSTSFFLCRASLKEGFWGETLSMCEFIFWMFPPSHERLYKIVVWTTIIVHWYLYMSLGKLSIDENATKFRLDYEQMTSNCCSMGRVKHDFSWNIHSTCGKTFRIRKNFPVSIADALTGFLRLCPTWLCLLELAV